MSFLDFFIAPKKVIPPEAAFRVSNPSTEAALQSNANYTEVVPGFRTGTSATDRAQAGRPEMVNVPVKMTAPTHQKYDSPPFPGGDTLQYDYVPYQKQPLPNAQVRQYGYPKPGIDLTPPDATYGSAGFTEGTIYTRVEAPFAANNRPPNIAPRPSEMLQDFGRPNYRPPLSRYLAQKTPVGHNPEMQFAHQLTSGLTPYAPARDYPKSTVGWTHREYFTDYNKVPGKDRAAAPATRERATIVASAPPQLQTSPGGLTINAYANVQKNLNTNLIDLYKGAAAPIAQSYSGICQ